MKKLRLLDLFSGIGGMSLGLERSGGFETVAFCEIEEFPRRVLAKHWPEVPCYEDVRTLTAERLAADGIAVDAICGGFPCQDVSIAGRREGLDGERSGLWSEFLRLVDELGASFVLIENVTALLSLGLARVLKDLCEIGYDAEWNCIPASWAGCPQNRDRIWIVAYPACERGAGPLQIQRLGTLGQGWACRQEDLQQVWENPTGRPGGWSQPLICRGNNWPPNWVDRISACGNAVVPQIPEMIGRAWLAAQQFHT